jgi:Peptidase family M28
VTDTLSRVTATAADARGRLLEPEELRGHIEWLAAMERGTASAGERAAGERLARILEALGFAVHRDTERVHGTYWWPIGLPAAAAALAGITRTRMPAALVGAAAAASTADDITAGPRWLRRILPRHDVVNVWGELGPADAARTVIVVAHHDAAHSGLVFEPDLPRALLRRLPPELLAKANTTPPTMWGAVGGPLLVALGALFGRRRLRALGALLSAGYVAAMADIGLRGVVPGANDNATGVAVALSLASWLAGADRPDGLRAVIVLPAAEESFMEGMVAWCDRHLHRYDRATTTVICLDTVGSPELVALEGEGMLGMNEYPKELLAAIHAAADELGIRVHRNLRFRNATDGLIALKRGYRTAMLGSVDEFKIPPNYHWPTDTADRVDVGTVADAARLCRRVIERL